MTVELRPMIEEGLGAPGIDYTTGDQATWYRGLGTRMIDRVLVLLRSPLPAGTPASVTPEADNSPSRRNLEEHGLTPVDVFQSQHLPGRSPHGPTARYARML